MVLYCSTDYCNRGEIRISVRTEGSCARYGAFSNRGYRNVSIDPSMRRSTRGGTLSSSMSKAIYGQRQGPVPQFPSLFWRIMECGRHDAARASASRQPASLEIEHDACVQLQARQSIEARNVSTRSLSARVSGSGTRYGFHLMILSHDSKQSPFTASLRLRSMKPVRQLFSIIVRATSRQRWR